MTHESERPIDFTHRFYTEPYARTLETVTVPYAGTDGIRTAETIFYPEGGGQPGDRGTVTPPDGPPISVTDTRYTPDGGILHVTDRPLPAGTPVTLTLDWPRRFSLMQQHSAEHLISGLIKQRYGYRNVGFHINETVTTLDTSGPLPPEALPELTAAVNRVIWDNRPFIDSLHAPEEIRDLDYRSKIALPHTVRLITVPEVDCCACCGTHCRATGEIGQVRFLAADRHRGGTRLTLVAGDRALADAEALHTQALDLGDRLSSPRLRLRPAVDHLTDSLDRQTVQLRTLSAALIAHVLPDPVPRSTLWIVPDGLPDKDLTYRIKRLGLAPGVVLLLLRPQGAGRYRFYARTPDADTQQRFRAALDAHVTVKGGGPPALMQGTFETAVAPGDWALIRDADWTVIA